MPSRALGAFLALAAAAAIVVSIAASAWWAGAPVVEGKQIEAKYVHAGPLGATGCNVGGDGSCEPITVDDTIKLVGYGALGSSALATLFLFILLSAALRVSDHRRGIATASMLFTLLAAAGAGALLALGPGIKASQQVNVPIGWGTFAFGGGILASLLASAITRRLEPEPLRLKPSLTPVPNAKAARQSRPSKQDLRASLRDSRQDMLHPSTPDGRAAAPQLRPLYEQQGYVPTQQAPLAPRTPAPGSRDPLGQLLESMGPSTPALSPQLGGASHRSNAYDDESDLAVPGGLDEPVNPFARTKAPTEAPRHGSSPRIRPPNDHQVVDAPASRAKPATAQPMSTPASTGRSSAPNIEDLVAPASLVGAAGSATREPPPAGIAGDPLRSKPPTAPPSSKLPGIGPSDPLRSKPPTTPPSSNLPGVGPSDPLRTKPPTAPPSTRLAGVAPVDPLRTKPPTAPPSSKLPGVGPSDPLRTKPPTAPPGASSSSSSPGPRLPGLPPTAPATEGARSKPASIAPPALGDAARSKPTMPPPAPGDAARSKSPSMPPPAPGDAARSKPPTAPGDAARSKPPTAPGDAARRKPPTAPGDAARSKSPSMPPPAAGDAARSKPPSMPTAARAKAASIPPPDAARTKAASIPPTDATRTKAPSIPPVRPVVPAPGPRGKAIVVPEHLRASTDVGTPPPAQPAARQSRPGIPNAIQPAAQSKTIAHAVPPMPSIDGDARRADGDGRRAETEDDDSADAAMRATDFNTAVEIDHEAKAAAQAAKQAAAASATAARADDDDDRDANGTDEHDAGDDTDDVDASAGPGGLRRADTDMRTGKNPLAAPAVGEQTKVGLLAAPPAPALRFGAGRAESQDDGDEGTVQTPIPTREPAVSAQPIDLMKTMEMGGRTPIPTLGRSAQPAIEGDDNPADDDSPAAGNRTNAGKRDSDRRIAADNRAAAGNRTNASRRDSDRRIDAGKRDSDRRIDAGDKRPVQLPISTAPTTLPPPKQLDAVPSGPTPACPQCESPMAWVDEHLRFYCRSCRMYF